MHQRCSSCSILMGPGHIETGAGQRCGTCRYTRRGGERRSSGSSPGIREARLVEAMIGRHARTSLLLLKLS